MQYKNKSFLHRVEDTIIRENILPSAGEASDKILVGLSGGADSVALLRALQALGYSVGAAHCNFHLRGEESDRDEQFCRTLCAELGIPLFSTHFSTREYATKNGVSIEMAARKLRYAYFRSTMEEEGYTYVAVAHHRDDNAETILLNLVRGTGLQGITGMAYRNNAIIRPLLDVSKQDILAYLGSIEQPYVTDSTNMVADVRRNIIRLRVMPILKELNPSIVETLVRDASNFREVNDFLEAETAKLEWQELKDGTRVIEKTHIKSHLILFGLLKPYGFTPSQTFDIWNHLHSTMSAVYRSRDYELLRDRDAIILQSLHIATPAPDLHFRAGDTAALTDVAIETTLCSAHDFRQPDPSPLVAWIDADKAGESLTLRRTAKGDRFVPFGMKGSKLVSRYMIDRKFDALQRHRQMVITNNTDILWLVGERTDDRYRVIPGETRRILVLKVVFM